MEVAGVDNDEGRNCGRRARGANIEGAACCRCRSEASLYRRRSTPIRRYAAVRP